MSWTPAPLRTKRLDLSALKNTPPTPFHTPIISQNRCEVPLQGLPSNWTVFLKGTEEAVGSIGYICWDRELRLGEIGFILKHNIRRRGYMSEACFAVIDYGFKTMGLQIIEGRSSPGNDASVRLLKKVGMKKEGRVKVQLSLKGTPVDLDIYRIRIDQSVAL